MLIFAAVTMNWFRVKCRLWEVALLAVACLLLFRPDFFMDYLAPEYTHLPPAKVVDVARDLPDGGRLVLAIKGTTIEGDDVTKTVAVRLGAGGRRRPQAPRRGRAHSRHARRQRADQRRQVRLAGEEVRLRAGLGRLAVEVPSGRATPHWFYLPAYLLIALVWWSQGRRMRPHEPAPHDAA